MKIINLLFLIFLMLGTTLVRADITTGLEGRWQFAAGSGTSAVDSSGNGNTGTLSSPAPTWVTGVSGVSSHALSFDGTNNYVTVPSSTSINTIATANQITISAWIKVSSPLNNTYQEIVRDNNWFLLINTSNKIALSTSGAPAEYTNGFLFTADGQWHLITGTFDGTTIRLYEDGALQTSYAGAALSSNTTPLYIGSSSGQYFSGSMDDVRVYSRALAQSDITGLFGKTPVSLSTDQISYTTTPATVNLTATTYPASGVSVTNVAFYSNNNGVVTDLGAGQATTANTYTLAWNNVPTGTYSMTAVVMDSTGAVTTSDPVTIYVNTQVLNYSVNKYGLQSLQYNGQQFLTSPIGTSSYEMDNVLYQTPNGTKNQYGWVTGAIQGPWALNSTINSYYAGPACSNILPSNWATVSPGSNPVCNQNIYRSGQSDGYTVSTLYTTAGPNTLKIDYYFTNNDPTDTLEQFADEYFMELTVPNMTNNQLWEAIGKAWNASPVAFIEGTWGSMALYTDDYTKNAEFLDVWTNSPTTSPANYLWQMNNYSTPGGDPSNTSTDAIGPGQTWHYTLYISFGTPADTSATLAPSAYTSFSGSFPYLVNWPDRRPIARWFMAGAQYISSTDPRGWNTGFNLTSQANFNASVLTAANNIINYMNTMDPKPQGILVWDLEGEEFYQPFTYVGNPPQLPNLAPEMDAAIDKAFAAFKAAGYQVGMTLRPSNFQTGSTLPSTCNYNSTSPNLSDVFILTTPTTPGSPNITLANGPSQLGGYFCSAPNTWTQAGSRGPAYQTVSDVDSTTLSWLEAKVTYAHNRWGARLFYVDSTVYHGGNSFNFNIFRQLQQAFPDCLFIPENTSTYYFGAAARYGDTHVYGDIGAPVSVTDIWPDAFEVIESYNADIANDGTSNSYYNQLLSGVGNGNVLFVDGWFNNEPDNGIVQQMYQDAIVPSNAPYSINQNGYGLTVASTGSGNVTGTISVTSGATNNQPVIVQEINCPSANCTAAFDGGAAVTLTAVPANGSTFSGWSGGGCRGIGTCVVTMSEAQTVTATFNTGVGAINYGDVNGAVNGSGQPVVTIADAEMTAQGAIGLITLNSTQLQAAEVDGTGKLDIYDAFLIAEYSVGLITQFPVQQ